MSHPYRIVQISDLHLLKLRYERNAGVPPALTFQEILNDIRTLDPEPHAVILSGDISDAFSGESYFLVERMMIPLEIPYYWIPGNHDDVTLMSMMEKQLSVHSDKVFDYGGRRWVLLNSVVTDEVFGRLNQSQLDLLRKALEESPDTPTMIVMHHQPIFVNDRVEDIKLQNDHDFFSILDDHSQVQGVFFGHIHILHESERNGVKYMSSPPSVFPYEEINSITKHMVPGYRVFDYDAEGNWETKVRYLDIDKILVERSFGN